MARLFLPLGRFIRAASQTKAFDAAQATSLAFWILKCQVSVLLEGLDLGSFNSSAPRMVTVLSLLRACAKRDCWVEVSTSFSFCNSPEPAIIKLAGAVIE